MHGTRNSFVVLDAFRQAVPSEGELSGLARSACGRATGFGTDGLLVVEPDDGVAARMTVYNADGSIPEMCGNGLRCVAKLVADRGYAGREFTIATGAGPRLVSVLSSSDTVSEIRIGLGRPILDAERIPTTLPGSPPKEVPLTVDGGTILSVTCVSMGNPHAVMFVDDPDAAAVESLGPRVERHPAFPNRTNVEFASVVSPTALRLRVWERGCGETAACGTGAGATAVAGVLTGRTGRSVVIRLRGGDLRVDWPADDAEVFLTGDAVTVDTVEWPTRRP